MFTLRPYQQAAVSAGLRSLAGAAEAGLLVEPTGSGKSLMIASIVKELDAPAIVFQPTKELVEQNAEKMLAYGFAPAIYSASLKSRQVGQVTLATIGSVAKNLDRFRDVRYLIYDEADLVNAKGGELKAFRDGLPGVRTLGLTATPFRLSIDGYGGPQVKFLTRTRPRVFTDVVHYTQIGDLLRQGFLCPLEYFEVAGFNPDRVRANTTGAEYDDLSLQRHFDEIDMRDLMRRVVERLLERGRKGILVFTKYVEDSDDLCSRVPGVRMVSAKTPKKERDHIIAAFKAGEIPAVSNCGVLTAGFDHPALDTVVLGHPSMSLRKYMQMVGRVVRMAPGKRTGWVVDMVGLVKRFGKLEDFELQAGGKRGQSWEFLSNGKPITNAYYARPDPSRRWHGRERSRPRDV